MTQFDLVVPKDSGCPPSLPGYGDFVEIYESAHSLAFRARRLCDNAPVIVKLLKEGFPSPREMRKYEREYEIGRELIARPGIARVLGLEKLTNSLALIIEDFGGDSLREHMKRRRFSLLEALQIAVRITECLGEIHAARIVHKDINPANLVYNPATGELKIVDFGISSRVQRETAEWKPPEVMEGTLTYISPEQTGRINRPLDFRTDFYSLGATLYELFTGRPPFEEEDPKRLVHRHIFEAPLPPASVDATTPIAVSNIILKLMMKVPEQRYQSALGICEDLKRCARQLTEGGRVEPFPLGEKDFCERLQIPQKLYGREREVDLLLSGFAQAQQGEKVIALISGGSGVGKSALAREVLRPLTIAGGTFVSGKYEQLRRGNPYSAIIDAFHQINRQIQSASEKSVASLRAELTTALGQSGQVILDLFPAFCWLLGPQPRSVELPPMERLNRFYLLMEKFVAVFARREHPLVLFLDDLQWADSGSLKLLKRLVSAPGIESLYLIGTYRDREVDSAHLLLRTIRELQETRCQIKAISLAPIALPDVTALLSETLRVDPAEALPLAELLLCQSDGNPFVLNELIEALFAAELLCLDARTGQWRWDLARIQARGVTENAAELLLQKCNRLDGAVQETLKVAACLGNRFELTDLSRVKARPRSEVAGHLLQAAQAGLLFSCPYEPTEREPVGSTPEAIPQVYQFAHDKIQQVVQSQIPEDRKRALHYAIGQTILQTTKADNLEERAFDVADHWNVCHDLLLSEDERVELVRINLLAGRKAKEAVAYQSALSYLRQGLRLHRDDWWEKYHALTLELHVEAGEAAYLNGYHREMETFLDSALLHSRTLEDRLRAEHIRIRAYASNARRQDVLRVTLATLAQMKVHLPSRGRWARAVLGLLWTSLAMRRIGFERLERLPIMRDPEHLAAMRLLADMGGTAYLEDRNLWVLVIVRGCGLTLRHGISIYSSVAYAAYGCILCGLLGDIEKGYRFGQLALQVLARFKERRLAAYVHFVVGNFVAHWQEPLGQTLRYYQESHRHSVENGDFFFMAFAGVNYCYTAYFAGMELSVLSEHMNAHRKELLRINHEQATMTINQFQQMAWNLSHPTDQPSRLSGEWYDEDQMIGQHRQSGDRLSLFDANLLKLILHLLFREHALAEPCAREARAQLMGVTATHASAVFLFYEALLQIALCEQHRGWGRRRRLRVATRNLHTLRKYARHAPATFEHKACLVAAELSRLQGRWNQAFEEYTRAITLARQHGFGCDQALAGELAFEFCLLSEKEPIAKVFLHEAHQAYLRWGALTKARDLETRHPLFFAG